MSQYRENLIKFATEEMPALRYDFENASTHFSLQHACQRLFNIVEYLLHDAVLDSSPQATTGAAVPPKQQPAPQPQRVAPVVRPVPQPRPLAPPANPLGLPTPGGAPQRVTPGTEGLPPDAHVQPGVANVFVTPQGTRIVDPSGRTASLPPGEAVDVAAITGEPELPPPPENGVNVVLPPGGGALPPGLVQEPTE